MITGATARWLTSALALPIRSGKWAVAQAAANMGYSVTG
jgi:hypothetical protein